MTSYQDTLLDTSDLSSLPDFDAHERVVRCEEPAAGLLAFVAIHDTTLGAGMGGCRMKAYGSESEAVRDALRLSRGMTYKYAAAGLSHGGAKAVIVDRLNSSERRERILAFARFVQRLGGSYTTAEDAGIETADIRLMSEATRHVRNLPLTDTGDGALCTAWGVVHGIDAGLSFRGMEGLAGRRVAVEGLGKVGMSLCSLLREAGADLVVYDIDPNKVAEAIGRFGAAAALPGRIHAAEVDVYAPCALGAVLNRDTIPDIAASIVAGAANNQLSDPEQDMHLRERGVTYCPDYVVNAGGVLSVADKKTRYDREEALRRVAGIRRTTADVLRLAHREGIPTGLAADRSAQRRIAGGRCATASA